MPTIGINTQLREARLSAGLTVKQLAAKLGCTQQYLSAVESGKKSVSIKQLRHIADALGLEVSVNVTLKQQYVT